MKSISAVLNKQVKSGDSMESVQKLLGPGLVMTGQPRQEAAQRFMQMSRENPKEFPDGVVGDDVFLGYDTDVIAVVLQFRNGKLINFNPKAFEKPPGTVD